MTRRSATCAAAVLVAAVLLGNCVAEDAPTPGRPRSADRPLVADDRAGGEPDDLGMLLEAAERHRRQGAMRQAFAAYQQAADNARDFDDGSLATALNGLGLVSKNLGDFHLALSFYHQALAVCRGRGDRACEAETLHNLGSCYTVLGELEVARDTLGEALVVWPSAFEKAATLTALATVDDLEGETEAAIERYRQAFALRHQAREVDGDTRRRGKATTLDRLATALKESGHLDEARRTYEKALGLARSQDSWRGLAVIRGNLAWLHLERRDPAAAVRHFAAAEKLLAAQRRDDVEVHVHLGMAHARRRLGDPAAAVSHLEQAIELVENQRAASSSPLLRASFLARRQPYYELYVDVLMDRHAERPEAGYDARALEIAERFKARSLLDLLHEERAALERVADADTVERREGLRHEINAVARRHLELVDRRAPAAEIAAAEREKRDLIFRHEHLEAELRRRLPAAPAPRPLDAAEIRRLLDPETRLLVYALGEERSFLWLVSPEQIVAHVLPRREEIEEEARRVYDWLRRSDQRQGRAEGREAVERLSRILLGPLAEAGAGTRLVILADGLLHYIPFAALVTTAGRPLVAEHEIVSLPSASVLAALRRRDAGRRDAGRPAAKELAVVYDPVFAAEDPRVPAGAPARLPYAAREAEAILELVPAAARLAISGFDASRQTVLGGELAGSRIVHFVTHGEVDDERPEYSHLVLSLLDPQGRPREGRLYLHEIDDLDLPAELVVLSACDTALGKHVRGEGLLGIVGGLMAAGATRVVVSLWPVSDEVTAELMERFYRQLLAAGRTPAAALRAAQVSIAEEERWWAPYYWAGFVLQGEWR